jgi:arylsulfatase A-like enzyme
LRQPNILLVILDATRADFCSCYGAERLTTPHLDALAKDGTLYEQAISPAPWTLPAFSSMFTGFFPSQLGIYENRMLGASPPTLAALLAEHGYGTFAVTGNSWLSIDFGLQRGFDHVHKLWQLFQTPEDINKLVLGRTSEPEGTWLPQLLYRLGKGHPFKNIFNVVCAHLRLHRQDQGAYRTARPLLKWIDGQQGPWFCVAHYMEAHLPYAPPRAWAQRFAHDWPLVHRLRREDHIRLTWQHLAGVEPFSPEVLAAWRDLYSAEVAYTDHHLGLLVRALEVAGILDDTVVIVTGDHGESLGEHGLVSHQYGVYDTLIRVPLVIRYPAVFPCGAHVSSQVQILDLFATILDLAGIDAPPSSSQSLLPEHYLPRQFTVAQEEGTRRIPQASVLEPFGVRPQSLERFAHDYTAVRGQEHKLIARSDGALELYAWKDDPGEEVNLASQYPEIVRDLEAMLRFWREQNAPISCEPDAQEHTIDPSTADRLRALGYIE